MKRIRYAGRGALGAAASAGVLLSACSLVSGPASSGGGLHPLVPATVEQDPRLPRFLVTAGGVQRAVHLQAFGDSTLPVLLGLHGSLSDHRSLLPLAELSDGYRVVLWDQRGNGLSERISREEYSEDSILREIDAIADAFSPGDPVVLVGHSFGAMYAALYMSRRPHRVRAAVLLEPGGLTGEIMAATFREAINVRLVGAGPGRTWWQNFVLSPSHHEALDQKALLILGDGSQTNYFCDPRSPPRIPVWRPGGFVEHLRGELFSDGRGGFRYDFARGLEHQDAPVLLVGGECSALGGGFQRRWHEGLFGNASTVEIPGVGHRMLSEDPEGVLQVIRTFLAALEGGG